MSIEYRTGDILRSGAEVIVVPVNVVGVAGAGLALAAKKAWPRWFRDYAAFCRVGMRAGDVVVHDPELQPQRVVSFATKSDWRRPSRIEWIAQGLDTLAGLMQQIQPRSIALPAVGCGLGGLPWAEVKPLVHAAAERMSAAGVDVWIYEPREGR